MKLGKSIVHAGSKPYVIAEIGVNHEGSMELAKQLIDLAAQGGAQAAKFQSYKAEKLASKDSPSYWDRSKEQTASQYELFKKFDSFGEAEYRELAEHCKKAGVDFISTPFDLDAVAFLEPMVPFFKVASADLTNLPLLYAIAKTKKPVVLSVGASRIGEVAEAVSFLRQYGVVDIVLLHCILNYPTEYENAHLRMIDHLRTEFPDCLCGYSDHTPPDEGMIVLGAAYAKGAVVLEKHFTHDKSLPGNDHYHAMDKEDLVTFVTLGAFLHEVNGEREKSVLESEAISRKNARRSLVAIGDHKKGSHLAGKDIICKRPGTGISPRDIEWVTRCVLIEDVSDDRVLQWSDFNTSSIGLNVVGIVQARMGSSRLPEKSMALINDKPLLEWVIERARLALELDHLVVALPDTRENQVLAELAERIGVPVFLGEEDDVLGRIHDCASQYGADYVVRICADNPFVDPGEIDRLVLACKSHLPDYAFNHVPKEGNNYVDGLGAECLRYSVLRELNRFIADPEEREHVTSHIWKLKHAYQIEVVAAPEELAYPEIRLDVDTAEDLERIRALASELGLNSTAAEIVRAARKTS